MKRLIIFLLIGIFVMSFSGDVSAATINAASCEQVDVQAAINLAVDGDTVLVPACAETTWSLTLDITTNISALKGAGQGLTNIKSAVSGVANPLIYYKAKYNVPFQLSGFTFNMNYNQVWLYIVNINGVDASAHVPNKIRIDHNTLTNTADGNTIGISKMIYGVMYNNTIGPNFHMDIYGDNANSWNYLSAYNTADCFYVEDNEITTGGNAGSLGWGGRRCFRYNNVVLKDLTHQAWQGIDTHGNQYNSGWSSQMTEIYGNKWDISEDRPVGQHYGTLSQLRSGAARIYFNMVIQHPNSGKSQTYVREEYSDEIHPPASSPISGQLQHVSDAFFWNNRQIGNSYGLMNVYIYDNCCSQSPEAWQPSHSYSGCHVFSGNKALNNCFKIWAAGTSGETEPDWDLTLQRTNPLGQTIDGTVKWVCQGSGTPIVATRDFADYTGGAFDGTSNGMGCGALASMPATCNDGGGTLLIGYWATNQDCTTISFDNVGAHPVTPISGTLYKCIGMSWVPYYTPYTYPHPLTLSGTTSCGFADANSNNLVEIGELINYISQWKSGSVNIGDLITAIGEWKNGC